MERPKGRRTAYYFYKEHPGERLFFPNYLDLIRVPADEVMHLFRPLRPGQLRGVPWLANALVRLWELDQYDDAELLRKKFAQCVAEHGSTRKIREGSEGSQETPTHGGRMDSEGR